MGSLLHRGALVTPLLMIALAVGCASGGGATAEESLADSFRNRGVETASVSCEASDALPYIQDFMKQAEAASTCEVQVTDGTAEQYCVVSDGEGSLLMATPDRTCEQAAAEYGRGPGLLEPGELEGQLESASSE